MTRPSIYLAGPDVFHPDSAAIGERKRALCDTYGLSGLYPLDNEVTAGSPAEAAAAIFAENLAMIGRADAIVANLTPFRGVSADPGTVFEIGYGFALGKPVFGYSNEAALLDERVRNHFGRPGPDGAANGRSYAADGLAVEGFGHFDNLMIAEALLASGSPVIRPETAPSDRWRDLATFEACLRVAADYFAALGKKRGLDPLQGARTTPA